MIDENSRKRISPQVKQESDDTEFDRPRRRKQFQGVALDVSLPPSQPIASEETALARVELDLSRATKVIFINGRGNTGKTALLRLVGELLFQFGLRFRLAACDQGIRSATRFFKQINTPDSSDISEIIAFLQDVILDAADAGRTYMIDMGAAGETAILKLHAQSDLMRTCQEVNVTPVFIHLIGISVDDVSVLAAFEQQGLCPPATALIFNGQNVGAGSRPEMAFDLVEAQPCVQQAIERGAAVIRMPGLDARIVMEIEARQILYNYAIMGKVGQAEGLGPLGPFDRTHVRIWREKALRQLQTIGTWFGLPPAGDGSSP